MPDLTYYVALPFDREEESGALVPGEATEMPSASAAISRARTLAKSHAGALAFQRAGDPNVGEFKDAIVLERFGETPEDLSEL